MDGRLVSAILEAAKHSGFFTEMPTTRNPSYEIAEFLFRTVSDESDQEVKSSHWQKYLRFSATYRSKTGHLDFNASGREGLGGFKKATMFARLKNLPSSRALNQILKKYIPQPGTLAVARKLCKRMNVIFGFDQAKSVLIYDVLNQYKLFQQNGSICIIGDGYGFMGSLIKEINPESHVIYVNLSKNLMLDALGLSKCFPQESACLFDRSASPTTIWDDSHTIFLTAENYAELSQRPISLFINVASMQEMHPEVIKMYFEFMRQSTVEAFLYCLNREEKILPGSEVSCFDEYPWGEADVLLDERCPFYQRWPSNIPPFHRKFDGPHRHKLVRLDRIGES